MIVLQSDAVYIKTHRQARAYTHIHTLHTHTCARCTQMYVSLVMLKYTFTHTDAHVQGCTPNTRCKCAHTCLYLFACWPMQLYINTCQNVCRIHVCIYICVYVHIYVCIYV